MDARKIYARSFAEGSPDSRRSSLRPPKGQTTTSREMSDMVPCRIDRAKPSSLEGRPSTRPSYCDIGGGTVHLGLRTPPLSSRLPRHSI